MASAKQRAIDEGNAFGADLPDDFSAGQGSGSNQPVSNESPSDTPAENKAEGAVSLFYPTELKTADQNSSQFKHWIKFSSYKIGTAATLDVIQKIADKIESITTAAGALSIIKDAGQKPGIFDKSIGLYVPAQTVNKIGIHYETKPLGFFENLFQGMTEVASGGLAESSTAEQVTAIGSYIAAAILDRSLKADSTLSGITDVVRKRTGIAINPRRTTLFEYPNLREFSFNFVFSPRDRDEENTVNEIIKYFKVSALPTTFGIGAFLNYPNEFELTCMVGSQENKALFKTKRCVIKEIDINYTPSNLFNAFPSGSATQCIMTLNFIETDILLAKDIEDGVAY